MKFAIVDIETTGADSQTDNITEIAIYIHDGNEIVDEFCTLVNPECSIPPFISRLTGITNEMVEDAPKFYEVAKRIVQITEGAVFVAHNASFDYNFIRESFKSLGYNYSREYLCTVRLSRKLLPGFKSYSLGNLCNSLNIKIENRHRAGGDAYATVRLFEMLLQKNLGQNDFSKFIKDDFYNLRFPPGFNKEILNKLPETPGVYYMQDEFGKIIYVGKSNNIRKRVLSHFRNKQSRKALDLRNSIADISFEETGNELVALLLESEEIKKLQPFYNRKLKRISMNHCIYSGINEEGYITLKVSKKESPDGLLCIANSHDHAVQVIDRLTHKFNLCQKLSGIYLTSSACFGYAIKECHGACIGLEGPDEYNKRATEAITSLQYKNPNFLIIENGRTQSEKAIVQIENGMYIGFGYFDPEFASHDPESLKDFVKFRPDNKDVSFIIRQYLNRTSERNVLVY